MKSLYFSILLFSLNVKAEDLNLLSYLNCHQQLDKIESNHSAVSDLINCLQKAENENSLRQISSLAQNLGIENYLRYYLREKYPTEESRLFLENCNLKKAKSDAAIGILAKGIYDLSFIDKKNPKFESNTSFPPEGFKTLEFYGNTPSECYNTGFKAASFISQDESTIVFAIAGTEGSPTFSNGVEREKYTSNKASGISGFFGGKSETRIVTANEKDKEDWGMPTGKAQLNSSCAQKMISDAINFSKKENKKIVFTGHSLGGAIAETMATKVSLELPSKNDNISGITFMSAGGRGHFSKLDAEIESQINIVNYVSLGDIVSVTGNHIGEIRELKRKSEVENKFKSMEYNILDTHTLDFDRFESLDKSTHLSGQELANHFSNYTSNYGKNP